MHTMTNPPMGNGWRKRLADKAAKDAARNDPELLARRAESKARIEAERAEQNRLIAEAQARIAADQVVFPPMPTKLAAEILQAFERYRSAGREATPAEVEALSRAVHGLPAHPGSPVVRVTHGLGMPAPVSGVPFQVVEPMAHQPDANALDNVLKRSKGSRKPEKTPELESGQFLLEGDDEDDKA